MVVILTALWKPGTGRREMKKKKKLEREKEKKRARERALDREMILSY